MQPFSWFSLVLILWNVVAFVTTDITEHPSWMLLEHERCGNSNADRIIGGRNASLGTYPWLARIGYNEAPTNYSREKNELAYRCGGSLINKLYVVTAAHCVADLPVKLRVAGIRVGEHNTATDPDCENNFCGEPVQDFEPEQIVVHKDYNNPPFKNDIAIIRLNKPVNYNELVGPICMVRDHLLRKNMIGETAEVAGWGIYDIYDPKPSLLLQSVRLPIVDSERCVTAFRKYADIGNQQMCVGGVIGQDSCGGDSGGPLMKVEVVDGPPKYYLIGVVSFGAKHCGESRTPAVYSKISEYLPWILDNIFP